MLRFYVSFFQLIIRLCTAEAAAVAIKGIPHLFPSPPINSFIHAVSNFSKISNQKILTRST